MIPCAFDEDNAIQNPPDGVEVSPLSIHRGTDVTGKEIVISCWKFTHEEWEQVQKTKRIWLTVMGKDITPLILTVQSPFIK